MAVTLRHFTEFGKHTFQHITAASSCGGLYAGVLLYFVSRVRCRRKESSRSLSHLLMSFLLFLALGGLHLHPLDTRRSIESRNIYCLCCDLRYYFRFGLGYLRFGCEIRFKI